MPGVVEFVAVAQVRPAVFRLDGGEVDVQVTVRLLRLFNEVDDFIGFLLKLWAGVGRQAVTDSFDPLTGI